VYVGAVRGAVGLCFRALRVVGLSEGRLPAAPREDPVLPEHLHARLPGDAATLLPSAADRSLAELHDLDRVVRGATARVAFSAPHLDLERSAREPSSLFVEAAAALGRGGPAIPDVRALERDAFAPSRRAARTFRLRAPLSEAAWQDRVAATEGAVTPAAWHRAGPGLDLARLAALAPPAGATDVFGPMDGALGAAGLRLPGLGAERALSPTRLRTLLACPHRFLYEVVLGWGEPAAAPSLGEIEPLAYGRLFHRVAERFGRAHGAAFGARRETLAHWLSAGDALCAAAFAELLAAYPLPGAPVRRQQLDRLRRDFRAFLEYDWDGARPRDYADVERGFGYDAPLALAAGARRVLHVRGYIDRLDREGAATLVRDLKTGRVRPRVGHAAAPDPVTDVQLGVYGLVVEAMAPAWGLPAHVAAAYAHTDARGAQERAFREDFATLADAARGWLALAAGLLEEGVFPRTPRDEDCRYCPFLPVCGPDARGRSDRLLAAAPRDGALAAFRHLKRGDDAAAEERV